MASYHEKVGYRMRRSTGDGPNPSGLCMCGCGVKTPIARRSNTRKGSVIGTPQRYVQGHQCRTSPDEYLVDENGCWLWQRALQPNGYGIAKTTNARRQGPAHRVVWERENGPLSEDFDLHHICGVRRCVNPAHLRPLSRAAHVRSDHRSRLTEQDVRIIRDNPHVPRKVMAERFGVSKPLICNIIAGRKWKGV